MDVNYSKLLEMIQKNALNDIENGNQCVTPY